MNSPVPPSPDFNRRDFVKAGSFAAMVAALGGVPIRGETPGRLPDGTLPAPKADPNAQEKPPGPPVKFGIIGLGAQGREVIAQLGKLPNGPVAAICDSYQAATKRAAEAAPNAKIYDDYKAVLDDRDVAAVVIATPTHLHRDIALAALAAGKHVYLEAPMAGSVDDARAIAKAAQALPAKQIFQVGQQFRANPQHHHVLKFFRTGACGKTASAKAQFNKKQSWRRASPNPDRERALNWRLYKDTSLGLIGEIGLHALDTVSWYLDTLPVSVTGFGGILQWQDDREVADTIQAVVEYPGGVRLSYSATLASSFEGEHQIFHGSDAAILIRDNKGWMFKEVDAPLLGWEVYARKDDMLTDSGIALVANATKILAQGKKPAEAASDTDSPLKYALQAFVDHVNEGTKPECGWKEAFEATVTAVKANEAVVNGGKVTFDKAWFVV
jgi:predicted dehydrogenase